MTDHAEPELNATQTGTQSGLNGLVGLGAGLAFTAVALGAFGAHGLEGTVSAQAADWWQTATFYLLPHAVAVLAIGLLGRPVYRLPGYVLAYGAIVFAATLYAMTLGAPRWLGMVTPLGGVGMLCGWGLIVWRALRTRT
jgi:uncharacterized membrane protein YgdD (TMEM256/DUF423 family)